MQWYTPLLPALGGQKPADRSEFEASLAHIVSQGYIVRHRGESERASQRGGGREKERQRVEGRRTEDMWATQWKMLA